jgi:hypothetical protein
MLCFQSIETQLRILEKMAQNNLSTSSGLQSNQKNAATTSYCMALLPEAGKYLGKADKP